MIPFPGARIQPVANSSRFGPAGRATISFQPAPLVGRRREVPAEQRQCLCYSPTLDCFTPLVEEEADRIGAAVLTCKSNVHLARRHAIIRFRPSHAGCADA